MSVAVAVTDSPEGRQALESAIAEAQNLGTGLLLINLTLHDFVADEIPSGLEVTVINRSGRGDRDPVTAVIDELGDLRRSTASSSVSVPGRALAR